MTITENLTRNPLGIIAVFISLIYFIANALIGISVGGLHIASQLLLVLFVIIFPVVVLRVFYILVKDHHWKLYAPQDFKSDEAFNQNIRPQSPAEIKERLREASDNSFSSANDPDQEIETGKTKDDETKDGQTSSNPQNTSAAEDPKLGSDAAVITSPAPKEFRQRLSVRDAFLIESLIFQDLQAETGGSLSRNIVLTTNGRNMEIDGLITKDGETTVAEIKIARDVSYLRMSVRRGVDHLIHALRLMPLSTGSKVNGRLFVAVMSDVQIPEDIIADVSRLVPPDIKLTIHRVSDLFAKYGISGQ